MRNANPKISCLCVTKNRVDDLKKSVECFRAQTYPNKEMLIVYDRADTATDMFFKSLTDPNIICYQYYNGRNQLTLGDVRNISIQQATGEYFCLWDDDDWHNKDRLTWQMMHITASGKSASVLLYIILYDRVNNASYMSAPRPWEGTVLCSKSFAVKNLVTYSSMQIQEDKSFIEKLIQLDAICPVIRPQLYIYNYTGNNTWDKNHFEKMFHCASVLPRKNTNILSEATSNDSIITGSEMLDNTHFTDGLSYEKMLKFFYTSVI